MLTAFLLQHWLHERCSLLRHTLLVLCVLVPGKVKVKFALEHAMEVKRGSRCRPIALLFLQPGARRVWVVTPRPGRLPPGKTRYPFYRRLGGSQGRSGRMRKVSPPPGFQPRTVQPVASRCNFWAIRVLRYQDVCYRKWCVEKYKGELIRLVIAYLFIPHSAYRRSCCPHANKVLSNYQHKKRSPLPQPAFFQNSGSTTCNGRQDGVQLRKRTVLVHFVLGLHSCDYGLHTSRVNTCTLYGCTVRVTMPQEDTRNCTESTEHRPSGRQSLIWRRKSSPIAKP